MILIEDGSRNLELVDAGSINYTALKDDKTIKITGVVKATLTLYSEPESLLKITDDLKRNVFTGIKNQIEKVIFHDPATIVYWTDGTKTVVKKSKKEKRYDKEKGLAMAICKKYFCSYADMKRIIEEFTPEG